GLDVRAGLFVATIAGGLLLAGLGDRARADDVVTGSVFAWALGLGPLPLDLHHEEQQWQRHGRRPRPLRLDLRARHPRRRDDGRPRRARCPPAARARPAAPLRVPRPARRRGAGRPRPAARPRLPRGARRRRGTGEPGRRRAPSARPRGGAGRRRPSRHSQPVPRARAFCATRGRLRLDRPRPQLPDPDTAAEHDDHQHRHPGLCDLTRDRGRAFYSHAMAQAVIDSPIGPLGLIASEAGLRAVLFDGRRMRTEGRSRVIAEAARQLDAYFTGELVTFDLELELHGTAFQRRCWLALASIPYGQTVSYGEQASRLGLGADAAR